MAKRSIKSGKCCLCGQVKDLNYEHVPPRSAFNKNTRFSQMPLMDYLDERKRDYGIKGRVQQGGIGYYAYCLDCNNFLGSKYVRAYVDWVQGAIEALSYGKFDLYSLTMKEQNPNKILKQIISMLIAMNGDWFSEAYPELVAFVKEPEAQHLDKKYRLFCYLNTGSKIRYSNFMVSGDLKTGQIVPCVELAFPPLGYVLTIDSTWNSKRHFEITQFQKYDPNINHVIELDLHRLQTNEPLPLDYRTREEIKKAREHHL